MKLNNEKLFYEQTKIIKVIVLVLFVQNNKSYSTKCFTSCDLLNPIIPATTGVGSICPPPLSYLECFSRKEAKNCTQHKHVYKLHLCIFL